jgi:hypothetical protein
MTVLPNCGEVVLSVMPPLHRRSCDRSRKHGHAIDPERNREQAARRARVRLRRYCKEHRLVFMWTLTYGSGGQRDAAQLRRQVERFIAKVVQARGGRFPYAYVIEAHKDGERLHVHMAVPFWMPHAEVAEMWGHGWVFMTDKRRKGDCAWVGAERAAAYLAKYVGKEFESGESERRRYEVARGWSVQRYSVRCMDFGDGQMQAEALFGGPPNYVWSSSECEDWPGPAVLVLWFPEREP